MVYAGESRGQLRLVSAAVIYPVKVLGQMRQEWVLAAGAGALSYLTVEPFVAFMAVAIGLGLADYMLGRVQARAQGRFDPRIAQLGFVAKISAYTELTGLRLLEGLLQTHVPQLPDTDGRISLVLCAALIIRELHSLDEKGLRIPLFGRALDALEDALGRLFPAPGAEKKP